MEYQFVPPCAGRLLGRGQEQLCWCVYVCVRWRVCVFSVTAPRSAVCARVCWRLCACGWCLYVYACGCMGVCRLMYVCCAYTQFFGFISYM